MVKKEPVRPRQLVTLGMILTRKAKSWDSRKRRSKDARVKLAPFQES